MTEQNYWSRRFSRRSLIRSGGLLGAGIAGAALIGCGEDEEAPAGGGGGGSGGGTAAPGGGTAAATQPAGDVKTGGTLRIGLPFGPHYDSLDMNRTTGTWTHLQGMALFDTLTAEDNEKNIIGALAESWELSPDFLSITFKLKQGVKFHNGEDFTAENVKFSLDRVADPENNQSLAKTYMGPNYQSTDVVDQYTAKVNLSAPNHTLLRRFTRSYFGLPSIQQSQEMSLDEMARNPIGTGPFTFVDWVQKQRIGMKRNEAYAWPASVVQNQGAPYLDGIDWIEIPDQDARASALESGDLDIMEEIPPVAIDRLKADDRMAFYEAIAQGQAWRLTVNNRLAPTDDVRVRQALNLAINKDEILNLIYFGVHNPAYGPLTSSSLGFADLSDLYPYSAEEAATLLEAAGWTVGADGIREKDGQKLELSYFSVSNQVAEVIQGQLRDLGVGINISIIPTGTQTSDRQLAAQDHIDDGGTQQAGGLNEDPDILRVQYHSSYIGQSPGQTHQGYSNPEVDALLEQQQQVPHGPERVELLQQAQRMIMEDAATVPIFEGNKVLATRNYVKGVSIGPVNFYARFNDTWLDT